MATLTVFSDAGDGYTESYAFSYADADSGTGTAVLSANTGNSTFLVANANYAPYYIWQGALSFDTSALGSLATVSGVALSLWSTSDPSTTSYTLEARAYDWTPSGLTTADHRSSSQLAALTRYATFTGPVTTGAYNTFSEDGTNFRTGVNKTGTTPFLIVTASNVAGTQPTLVEDIRFSSADETGTTQDPKLVITYTLPVTRFYLSATTAAAVSPSFAAWGRTTEGDRRKMSPTKDGSTLANKSVWANGTVAANATALCRQFVSDPMPAGLAFDTSHTMKMVVRAFESSTNDNINRTPVCVKIVSLDGSTLRATLKALGHYGPNTTEWNTSLRSKQALDGDACDNSYTTVLGDRLVVEIGGQVDGTGGTSVTGNMNFGSSAAADLDESETDTGADNPWFEYSGLSLSFVTILSPAIDTIAFTGQAPTLKNIKNLAAGAPAAIALTGQAPTAYTAKVLSPPPGSLALTGQAATLASQVAAGSPAAVTFTGHAPELVAIRGLRPRAGVRVELYARAWNGSAFVETKIGAGPIPVMTARYSEAEAEIGAFSFTMPADHPRAELLDPSDEIPGARYARIFVGGEGYVFLGEITNIKRTASADGRRVLVASGWSSARELTRLKTGFGFTLTDETMADAVDAILDGTGWTAGSIASAAIATYVLEANGASRFQALTRLAEIQGFMLRFNSTTRTVDMGPLGTNPEGIRFTAIEGPISPRFRSAVSKVIPIASAQIVSESEDVRNKVRIEGQIQGVDGDALTLAESSLDTPYVRQTETGPDGRTVYFIADATSIAANGVFEEDLVRRDIRLIGTDATERERAANSLYGAAVTFILEHKDRVKTFAMTPVGLRHLVEDVDIAPVAGKYPVWFRGWRDERDGRRVWVEIDQDLYLLRRERVIDSSGRSTWALGWSTTTRELSSDDQEVASTISELKAATAARLPMVTWGGYPPIGRLTSIGMDIISGDNTFGGGITEPRQIRHVSSDFVTQHASRWAQIIDGDQRFLIDEIRGDADGMITRRAWNYPTNDDSQLTSDNLVMPDGLTFDAFKFIYYFTFKGTVVGAYKRISTSPEKWAWVSYRNGSLKEVGGNMKATNDGPYFLPAGPERGQYYANDYTTWRPLSRSTVAPAAAPTTTIGSGGLTAVNLPSSIATGDLLFVMCSSNVNAAHATPSGWTKAVEKTQVGGGFPHATAVFYKVAAGTESGTTPNFSAGVADCVAHAYRVPAGKWTGAVSASAGASGTTSACNPDSLALTGRFLVFAVGGYSNATIGANTPYSNTTQTGTSNGGQECYIGTDYTCKDVVSSEDPAGFTGSVTTWEAMTVAVRAADNAVDADTTITNLIVSPAATPDYIQIELAVGDPGSEVSIGEHKIVPGDVNNFIPIDLSAGDRISARISGGAAYLSVQLLDQADAA